MKFIGKKVWLSGIQREIIGTMLDARLSQQAAAAKMPITLHERTLAADAWKRLEIGELKEERRQLLTEGENYEAMPRPIPGDSKERADEVAKARTEARAVLVEKTKEFNRMMREARAFKVPSSVYHFIADAAKRVGEWMQLGAEASVHFVAIAEIFGVTVVPTTPAGVVLSERDGFEEMDDSDGFAVARG